MDLSVAVGVKQDTVVHVVWASQGAPDDVMVVPTYRVEVFPFNPLSRLLGVSSHGPLPQAVIDGTVDALEGGTAHHMAMVIGPSSYHRVQLHNELPSGCSFVRFDRISDFVEERLHVLLGWGNEQFVLFALLVLA